MNTWKLILATVVIFGAGVITGGLLVNHVDRTKFKQLRPRPTVPQPAQFLPPPRELPRRPEQEIQRSLEQRRIEFVLSASRELKLSPAQRERIEQIIHEGQERTRELWEQVGPQMRKELADVKERVRQELTPPQRKLFEELMKRQQVRRPEETQPLPGRPGRENRRPAPPRESPPAEHAPNSPPQPGNP